MHLLYIEDSDGFLEELLNKHYPCRQPNNQILFLSLSFPFLQMGMKLFFLINLFIFYIFIFGCIGSSFLCMGEQGLLFIVVRGLLISVASLVAEHGL